MTHTWVGIALAIVGLGIMVLVHEWGHFIVARLFNVRVDVFSIGYGNRIFGWRRGDTDYRLSVFPFGGYVRMAGENPTEELTGAPYEFLGKPRWQRFFIILAGPTMNAVLAFALMWGLYVVGMPVAAYMQRPVEVAGVLPDSPAAKAGIQPGDKIVEINDTKIANWEQAGSDSLVIPGRDLTVHVERSGGIVPLKVAVPQNVSDLFSVLGYPKERVIVDQVDPNLPAAKAGLKHGDEIISANGQTAVNFAALQEMIQKSPGKPVDLVVRRDAKEIALTMLPINTDPGDGGGKRWVVGYTRILDTVHESYPVLQAAQQSWTENTSMVKQVLAVLTGLFTGRVSLKELAGPVGIVRMSSEAAKLGAAEFIFFMAFLSINLGILNLLPIPILDGGHVLMLAIEGTLRRDLSLAVKERFVQVGLVFLLAVFGFVMYYDVVRLFQVHY
ncbi:MAG TPA: RIP metalloprotease RseP [Candidatus Acidoferrales bacterium]|nr:RIP metalloprotease RseP [Candidatus Acidoferrales bacterium]